MKLNNLIHINKIHVVGDSGQFNAKPYFHNAITNIFTCSARYKYINLQISNFFANFRVETIFIPPAKEVLGGGG